MEKCEARIKTTRKKRYARFDLKKRVQIVENRIHGIRSIARPQGERRSAIAKRMPMIGNAISPRELHLNVCPRISEFLDMSQHLNEAGYKDAAAVIAGSTLESHLKELAVKNGIAVTDANGRSVKADKLNADLAKAAIYGVLDQKAIVANLDLRNKAARGRYTEYNKDQVTNLIAGIEDFIKRTPA